MATMMISRDSPSDDSTDVVGSKAEKLKVAVSVTSPQPSAVKWSKVCSGTQNNPQTSNPAPPKWCQINDVLLVEMGTWHSPNECPARIRLQAKPGLVGKLHTRPLLRCPQFMLSAPE
ncbi:uncharacterized protein TNCV_1007031 [Trichonephila clavipes]|nr:uncharacterized protein TNCV_1007031 [Trichonephila clavipes]